MQQQKSKRWFPQPGDLVAVPHSRKLFPKRKPKPMYGLVVQETKPSDFIGVWWDVFYDGEVESINIQTITPLWDAEGKCLRN